MSNSCFANYGRRQLEAAPLLPRKRPPLDSTATPGRLIKDSDSDSSSASTQRRLRRRRPQSPTQRTPVATPQTQPLLPPIPSDPDFVESEVTRPQALGTKRNEIHLTWANAHDALLMSKYLPAHMHAIMPQPIMGPDDHFRPPPDFLLRLQRVAHMPVPAPDAPSLIFETNPQALAHNAQQIANADYNLSQLLHQNQQTTLHFGSKFRPIEQLEDILGGHPLFGQLAPFSPKGWTIGSKASFPNPTASLS
jgi:hypothetical protein